MNVLKKVLKILLFMSVIMMTEGKELRIMSYNIYGSRLANGIKLGESIKKYRPVYFLTRGAAGTKSISYIIRDLAVGSSRTQYARANTIGVFQIVGGMLIILTINLIFRTPKKQANRLKVAMSNDKGGK